MYLVECYNDATVLRALGLHPGIVKHLFGKGPVIRALQSTKRTGITCVMDLDRNKTGMQGLPQMKEIAAEHGLLVHEWKGHRVIMVDDYLEDWLVRMVHLSKTRMSEFRLPDDARAVHRLEQKEGDPKITRVVQHLVESRSPGMLALMKHLRI